MSAATLICGDALILCRVCDDTRSGCFSTSCIGVDPQDGKLLVATGKR
jgi:hypothetical protein